MTSAPTPKRPTTAEFIRSLDALPAPSPKMQKLLRAHAAAPNQVSDARHLAKTTIREKARMGALEPRITALALVKVLQMWSNERYKAFLQQPGCGELTQEWFRWFVGSWNVARTIKDRKSEFVRKYLDQEFRRALLENKVGDAVDVASIHLRQQGWSSQKRKSTQGVLPISLVSKVGFFLCPEKLVPFDRYAMEGLNRLRRAGGDQRVGGRSFREYFDAFNEQYSKLKPQLAAALKEPWVLALAEELGCPASALRSIAARRKLFDNYLMHLGDYQR